MAATTGFRYGIEVNGAALSADALDALALLADQAAATDSVGGDGGDSPGAGAAEVVQTVQARIRQALAAGVTVGLDALPHLSECELLLLEIEQERRRNIDRGKLAALIGLACGAPEAWRVLPDDEPESRRAKADFRLVRDSMDKLRGGGGAGGTVMTDPGDSRFGDLSGNPDDDQPGPAEEGGADGSLAPVDARNPAGG